MKLKMALHVFWEIFKWEAKQVNMTYGVVCVVVYIYMWSSIPIGISVKRISEPFKQKSMHSSAQPLARQALVH